MVQFARALVDNKQDGRGARRRPLPHSPTDTHTHKQNECVIFNVRGSKFWDRVGLS